MKKIYIILSHSGSMPSRIIKFFTLFKYSHVSIALKKDLRVMYSFGRKKLNNPFDGGFITEDKNGLFYKKFYKTKCVILEIDVSNKQYRSVIKELKRYEDKIDIYKYDILGLVFRIFNFKLSRDNYKVCTTFVGDILKKSNIYKFNSDYIKPKDFFNIPNINIIYDGYLVKYGREYDK